MSPRSLVIAWLLLTVALAPAWAADAAATAAPFVLKGNVIEGMRCRFTIAPTGFPEQLELKATPYELPAELRAPGAAPTVQDLALIGRGPQLRTPVRLEAKVAGQAAAAVAAAPLTPTQGDGVVTVSGKLAAGPVSCDVQLRYERDGALTGKLVYSGGAVEALDLVLDLAGRVDLVFTGPPVADKPQVYPAARYQLEGPEGIVWSNSAEAIKKGRHAVPGPVAHAFVGNGDAGFTWLAETKDGWDTDPVAPAMTLERDKAGQLTWRIRLVNHAAKLSKPRTLEFALLTHPATFRAPGARRVAWLQWPFADRPGKTMPLTLASRTALLAAPEALLRADAGGAFGELTSAVVLEGPAGGAALSAEQDLAETYPMALFRYLAGTHQARPVRLRGNSGQLIQPGMSRAADRVVLGRALLHDIGVDARGLAHRLDGLRVVSALNRFGYFAADDQTEFIPYWRSRPVLGYGEEFKADDAFAIMVDDPLARVYVSAYRRPCAQGKGQQALIVILNESPNAVREQLYVHQPARLFGGPNQLQEDMIVRQLDFSKIPAESDWSVGILGNQTASTAAGPRGPAFVLNDVEDGGFVQQPAAKGGIEVYGPIFIPPHDFRILFGTGAPPAEWRR